MSIATLLNISDPAFAFDHDQLHRQMSAAAGGLSTIQYLLDPIVDAAAPAGWWDTTHAAAHLDFAHKFPRIYPDSLPAISDIDLSTGPTSWWEFANRRAHDLALTVLPP